MSKMSIQRVGFACGARVTGIDLSKPLTDDQVRAIHHAWLEHLVLVFPGQIFGGLSQLDVAAVGHLTAALTAAAATALILSRRNPSRRNPSRRNPSRQSPSRQSPSRGQGPDEGSGGHVTDAHPDQVGDRGGAGA